jgi:hypothetical protein
MSPDKDRPMLQDCAGILVRADAHLEPEDPAGDTPVYVAIARGFLELAVCLVEHGAGLRHRNQAGNLAVVLAAQEGHVDVVRAMLNADKASPPLVNLPQWRNGVTPLISAVFNNRDGMIRLLLAYGADPTIVDHQGHSALHCAAQQHNLALVSDLKDAHTRLQKQKQKQNQKQQQQQQQQQGRRGGGRSRGSSSTPVILKFPDITRAVAVLSRQSHEASSKQLRLLGKIFENLVTNPETMVSCVAVRGLVKGFDLAWYAVDLRLPDR